MDARKRLLDLIAAKMKDQGEMDLLLLRCMERDWKLRKAVLEGGRRIRKPRKKPKGKKPAAFEID
ncbi:hypothetical protein ES703_120372 [subsurface metagenome]